MIRLQILVGAMAGVSWTARHFPVHVGRGPDNQLRLEEAGVWERHFTIECNPAAGITLRSEPDALVTVNQQPARTQVLRTGDSIEFGSVRLRFWITEPERRPYLWREAAAWVLLAFVFGAQLWLLWRLQL